MSKEWILYKDCRGNCYFVDENGVESECFAWAKPYDENGIALVKLMNRMYAYRDMEGCLSKSYRNAFEYSNGFGLVQLRNEKWAFRDVKGNLSEEYMDAWNYCNGFAEVKTLDGKHLYRDRNGNLLEEAVVNYLRGKIGKTEFSDEEFADEKYWDMIIKRTKNITSQSIDLAENDEQLEASRDYYNDTMEYVLSKAYDVKVQKEELERQQKERELFATKKKKLLEELNLVD